MSTSDFISDHDSISDHDFNDFSSRMIYNLRNNVSYFGHDFWQEFGDPSTDSFPLINGGPWRVIAIVCLYLVFCTKIGPALMKHRKSYNVTQAMILYNLALSFGNGLGFLAGIWITKFGTSSFVCQEESKDGNKGDFYIHGSAIGDLIVHYGGWIYFASKFIDFMDTIFFILRKSFRQVTTLHLFHHSFMPICCYIGLKFVPRGNIILIPLVNVGIHSVMYAYYAMAAMGHRNLWWKKYLTMAQVFQFPLFMIHSIYGLINPSCYNYSSFFSLLELFYALIFFNLFWNFYSTTYKQRDASVTISRHVNKRSSASNNNNKILIPGFNSTPSNKSL